MKATRAYVIVAAVLAALLSCERKDLYDEATTLTLDMEVSQDDSLAGGVRPGDLYRGLVYDRATGARTGYAFVAPTGGELPVPAGEACVVVHTFGCEACVVADEDLMSGVCVTTNRADAATQQAWVSALSSGLPVNAVRDSAAFAERRAAMAAQYVAWEPDGMWAAVVDSLRVPRRAEGEAFGATAVARPVFEAMRIRLTGVEGMRYVASARAFLTGMAPSRRLVDWSLQGHPVAVAPSVYRDGDDLVVEALAFGPADGGQSLLVTLTDLAGTSRLYEYDLAGRLVAGGEARVPSAMEVEACEAPSGGGFAPTIEDWHMKVVPVRL